MSIKIGTVALTGGTGFLGVHLVRKLLNHGYEVRLLKRPGGNYPQAIEVNFEDSAELRNVFSGCDAVIHAAGLVSYKKNERSLMYKTNVELTQRVLQSARESGAKRFVHVSSIVTLGQGTALRNETSSFNAQNLELAYWSTKYEAERFALTQNSSNFEVVSVNPGTLLGGGDEKGRFMPIVRKLATAAFVFVPDGGSDFVDVEDAAEGTVLALEKGRPGERYILGSENLTYKELYLRLRSVQGLSGHAAVLPRWFLGLATGFSARLKRVNGVYLFHDCAKAKKELGYRPRSIDGALRVMLEEKSK